MGLPKLDGEEVPLVVNDRVAAWTAYRAHGRVIDTGQDFVVTDTEGVDFALRRPDLFSSAKAFDYLGSPFKLIPIGFDPPEHGRYRRILNPLLSPRRVKQLESGLRDRARALVQGLGTRCEVIEDIGDVFPTQAFLALFGMPIEDAGKLIKWQKAVAAAQPGIQPSEENLRLAGELIDYLTTQIASRRAESGTRDDLLGDLMNPEPGETPMTDGELLGTAFFFMLAGLDTVASAIGFAFLHLERNPDVRKSMVADPSTIPAVVEELLRIEAPVHIVPRVTTQDVEIAGCPVPANSFVRVLISGPNVDPALHPDPEKFCPARTDTRHMTFGAGIHRCAGSHLARAELVVLLDEFHKVYPDYTRVSGGNVRWPAQSMMVESLVLDLHRAPA